jgi:hypothetical protein
VRQKKEAIDSISNNLAAINAVASMAYTFAMPMLSRDVFNALSSLRCR